MTSERETDTPTSRQSEVIEGELIQRSGENEYRYQWREERSEKLDLSKLTVWQRVRIYGRLALLVMVGLAVVGALVFGAFMVAGVGLVLLLGGWLVMKVFGAGPVAPGRRRGF